MKAISLIISAALLLGLSAGKANAITCDAMYVIDNGVSLTVKPTNIDYEWDNDNVECALEFATQENIPLVQLLAGRYVFEQPVKAYGFKGTLLGKGMWEKTIIKGELEFIGGSPTIEHLQIETDEEDLAGILALQDSDNCDRPMFVSLNRVAVAGYRSRMGFGMGSVEECDGPLKGSLSINRSDISGGDEALVLSGLGSGARISLTNNDLNGNNEGAVCILSLANQIAFSALANSCRFTSYSLVVLGDGRLSRSDFYLRANTLGLSGHEGKFEIQDYGQRLNVHLEDNRVGTTWIGRTDQPGSGRNITFNALNNKLNSVEDDCLRVVGAQSVIAGNECDVAAGRTPTYDLWLQDTDGSTVNQPNWLSVHPSPNRNLLSNAGLY